MQESVITNTTQTTKGKMKIGDIVIPINGEVLACGCGHYDCAVIASITPFVLVSVDGDMIWSNDVNPYNYKVLCQASMDVIHRSIKRCEK